jgi:hypothetical protein
MVRFFLILLVLSFVGCSGVATYGGGDTNGVRVYSRFNYETQNSRNEAINHCLQYGKRAQLLTCNDSLTRGCDYSCISPEQSNNINSTVNTNTVPVAPNAFIGIKGMESSPGVESFPANQTHTPPLISFGKSSLEDAKKKCIDLGFKPATEKFGQCVLRLSK